MHLIMSVTQLLAARELMVSLQSDSVRLVIDDVPYLSGGNRLRDAGGKEHPSTCNLRKLARQKFRATATSASTHSSPSFCGFENSARRKLLTMELGSASKRNVTGAGTSDNCCSRGIRHNRSWKSSKGSKRAALIEKDNTKDCSLGFSEKVLSSRLREWSVEDLRRVLTSRQIDR